MTGLTTDTTRNGIPFVRMGEGPTLVVLNGGQGFVRRASPERLARDARRVAKILPQRCSFVLFGYDPAPAERLSIDDVVGATCVAIEEVAAGAAVDLVGISYGGMIACRVAAIRPGLVRRLVLVEAVSKRSRGGCRGQAFR